MLHKKKQRGFFFMCRCQLHLFFYRRVKQSVLRPNLRQLYIFLWLFVKQLAVREVNTIRAKLAGFV